MEQHHIKCEVCDRRFDIEPMPVAFHLRVPDGWFTLFNGMLNNQAPWHFCSEYHLAEWLHMRIQPHGSTD